MQSLRGYAKKALLSLYCALFLLVGAPEASETVTYFHNDISGSPVLATDSNGNVVWKESYRPYGDRLQKQAASTNNDLWFAGKPADATTGLSYFGARYYDPLLGRFVGIDPAPFDPNNVHSFNRYAYANNNPYRFVDPDGNSPIDIAFFIYDLGKLGVAIYNGDGVSGAAGDVLLSAVGVVSPIPGVGQALKTARVVDHAVEAGRGAAKAEATLAKAERLATNRAAGLAAEARAKEELIAEGNEIIGSQVTIRTAKGLRVVDHLIQTPEGRILAVEVKSGGAVRNGSQLAKDKAMVEQGGLVVGKNGGRLRGEYLKIDTIEKHY